MRDFTVTSVVRLGPQQIKLLAPLNTPPIILRLIIALALRETGVDTNTAIGHMYSTLIYSIMVMDSMAVKQRLAKQSMPYSDEPLSALADLFDENKQSVGSISSSSIASSSSFSRSIGAYMSSENLEVFFRSTSRSSSEENSPGLSF